MGYALVNNEGLAINQGIVYLDSWEDQLKKLIGPEKVDTIVLGNGTNRVNIAEGLRRLLPQAEIVMVDETASTVEAWQLKRDEEAGANPFLRLGFFFRQLFAPVPVDDYAARVLAKRYLDGLRD